MGSLALAAALGAAARLALAATLLALAAAAGLVALALFAGRWVRAGALAQVSGGDDQARTYSHGIGTDIEGLVEHAYTRSVWHTTPTLIMCLGLIDALARERIWATERVPSIAGGCSVQSLTKSLTP